MVLLYHRQRICWKTILETYIKTIKNRGSNERAKVETDIGMFINGPYSCSTGHAESRSRGGRLQAPGSNERAEEQTGIGLFINGPALVQDVRKADPEWVDSKPQAATSGQRRRQASACLLRARTPAAGCAESRSGGGGPQAAMSGRRRRQTSACLLTVPQSRSMGHAESRSGGGGL
ncbi:hypothetical protein NDU88_008190 [Pleurodeles waltl]|uniref:Uncharacterized protein n=1 Tax=Pleurodeles waltl TaxID=8319 RepID=A0AAV7VSH2_PLEWA|nr:hypothetical protein NDU88_008190 [Pleurodeles waltl]